jgi:hypothetical protein
VGQAEIPETKMRGVLPDWLRVVSLFAAPGWWGKPWPFGGFLFGLLMLVLAVIGTFTGKAYGKGGRSADRGKEPFSYWLTLVIEYLGGGYLIWYWLNDKF